jgi:uncharacterized protein (DUF305 family)
MIKVFAALFSVVLLISACSGGAHDNGTVGSENHSQHDNDNKDSMSSHSDHGVPSGAIQPEIVFADMMIPHHEQAIIMSDIILGKEDASDQVKNLAQQIKAEQQPEIDQMTKILERFGAEPTMDHSDHNMPGMLSAEQLDELRNSSGEMSDRLFLAYMILHHKGAIIMAEEVIPNTKDPEVLALAASIIETQQKEILQMEELLSEINSDGNR